MKKAIGLLVLVVVLTACGTGQLEAPENQEGVSAQSPSLYMADPFSTIGYANNAVPVTAVFRLMDRRGNYPNDPRLADISSYWKVEISPATTLRCAYNNVLYPVPGVGQIDCTPIGRFPWSLGLKYATNYTISVSYRSTPTSPWVAYSTLSFRTLPLVLQ